MLLQRVCESISQTIVGLDEAVEPLLIALLSGGHVLLEGVPGVAKTLLVDSLARALKLDFKRLQCTIDLMPSDITGSEVYDQRQGRFWPHPGPVFTNFLLADEINRATPKAQSALLEAMQERRVTIGRATYALRPPFLVVATRNPNEQGGTFGLPEAQLDRFMLSHRINYPSVADEREVVKRHLGLGLDVIGDAVVTRSEFDQSHKQVAVVSQAELSEAVRQMCQVVVSDVFRAKCVEIVSRTRNDESLGLDIAASPRASISLAAAARAHAFLHGRTYAIPDDLRDTARDVLRHRLRPSYQALGAQADADAELEKILDKLLAGI